LLIAAARAIKKEFYLRRAAGPRHSRPLIMASTEGGMDIEEVADESIPEKIFKESIDPAVGIMPFQGASWPSRSA
jgi:succinyl-CoA synthetase beta subunit